MTNTHSLRPDLAFEALLSLAHGPRALRATDERLADAYVALCVRNLARCGFSPGDVIELTDAGRVALAEAFVAAGEVVLARS